MPHKLNRETDSLFIAEQMVGNELRPDWGKKRNDPKLKGTKH